MAAATSREGSSSETRIPKPWTLEAYLLSIAMAAAANREGSSSAALDPKP